MCDRPLRGFQIGYTRKGKPNYLICSADVDYIWTTDKDIYRDGKIVAVPKKWNKGHGSVPASLNGDYIEKWSAIPCGSCLSCRITRAAEMADRAMLEMQYHDKACFITLTYDDEHIIRTNWSDPVSGEMGVSETLFKKHYIDFIKRLRKYYKDVDIRYILCGEYGDTTFRPHYHAIIFGIFPEDALPYSVNHRNQLLYTSDILTKLWRNGYVIVGECTRDSCNYVCRYVTKKYYGSLSDSEYRSKGRIPPFITSSKRPAIGKRWYEDNKDWCLDMPISYPTPDGGHTFDAPRYFRKLRESVDDGKLIEYNLHRDAKSQIINSQVSHMKDYTDLTPDEQAAIRERQSNNKAAGFLRDKI